jgi:hypothetical protein
MCRILGATNVACQARYRAASATPCLDVADDVARNKPAASVRSMCARYLSSKRATRFCSSVRVRMMSRQHTTTPVTKRNQFAVIRDREIISNATDADRKDHEKDNKQHGPEDLIVVHVR